MEALETTTIGSFPLEYSPQGIAECTLLQIRSGIDYPALPQLRDFVEIYLSCISGIELTEGKYVLVDYPTLRGLGQLDVELKYFVDVIAQYRKSGSVRGGKFQITGPITLCSRVRLPSGSELVHERDLVHAVAEVLAELLRKVLQSYGNYIDVVFIDEPAITYATWIGYSIDDVIEVIAPITEVARYFKKEVGLHVCGKVKGYSTLLLELPVDILHHEMYGVPENIEVYRPSELSKYGKKLGVGAIDNRSISVESIDDVASFLDKMCERYGPENIVVAPNCGFAALRDYGAVAMEVVEKKLRVMSEAVSRLRAKYLK